MRRTLVLAMTLVTAGCGLFTGVEWDRVAVGDGSQWPGPGPGGDVPPSQCKSPLVDCLTGCCPENNDNGVPNQIAAGGLVSCATTTTGKVRCWGSNQSGELGRGRPTATLMNSSRPLDVWRIPAGAKQVSVGVGHVCAIVDGMVACWGMDTKGSLGTGSTMAEWTGLAVVARTQGVPTSVAAGENFTCAVLDGAGYCWGANDSYQVGDEGATERAAPHPVPSLGGGQTTMVATGSKHACAIHGGGVRCWGENNQFRLGVEGPRTGKPFQVTDFSAGATTLSLGMEHSCALQGDRALCWGGNIWGELGTDRSELSSVRPVVPMGHDSGVTSICAGYAHTCAVKNGGVKCWGGGSEGQLGIGSKPAGQRVPTQVTGLGDNAGVTQVACGMFHTCALLEDGRIRCWGNNREGQLGDGTVGADAKAEPVAVMW